MLPKQLHSNRLQRIRYFFLCKMRVKHFEALWSRHHAQPLLIGDRQIVANCAASSLATKPTSPIVCAIGRSQSGGSFQLPIQKREQDAPATIKTEIGGVTRQARRTRRGLAAGLRTGAGAGKPSAVRAIIMTHMVRWILCVPQAIPA